MASHHLHSTEKDPICAIVSDEYAYEESYSKAAPGNLNFESGQLDHSFIAAVSYGLCKHRHSQLFKEE